jgi:hypothetical protein
MTHKKIQEKEEKSVDNCRDGVTRVVVKPDEINNIYT